MIFICFSGDVRMNIVKNLIYHLNNFKLDYWYDNYNLTLGDNKSKEIFKNGIDKSKYVIIVYSNNFFDHKSSVEEEKYILSLLKKEKIKIYPLLYKIKISELPLKSKKYLQNIIYNEIDDSTNLYYSLNQILISILKSKYNFQYNKRFELDRKILSNIEDEFIKSQLNLYFDLDEFSKNNKTIILKVIFDYLYYVKKIVSDAEQEYNIFSYLIKKINYNLTYDFKEIELLTIILNHYLNLLWIYKIYLLLHFCFF